MRIGITCYPTFGGSGVLATELGKALSKRGHEIHFIAYALPHRLGHIEENIFFHEVTVNTYPLFDYPPYSLALSSKMVDVALNKWRVSGTAWRPVSRNNRVRPYWRAKHISTPAAPAPTTPICKGPCHASTRVTSRCHRAANVLIGFTGTTNFSAPGTWFNPGVDPMLIDNTS